MSRKQLLFVLMGGLTLVLVAHPVFADDRDRHGCSVERLDGLYLFRASGFNIPASGPALPKAINELIHFNGDGTVSVPGVTVSVNGGIIVLPAGSLGTYTVTDLVPSDGACAGTLIFTNSGPSFNLVFSLKAQTIWMIQTNSGTVFEGTATKIAR